MNIELNDIHSTIDQARQWRVEHDYTGRGGVVVLYAGEVQGWVEIGSLHRGR